MKGRRNPDFINQIAEAVADNDGFNFILIEIYLVDSEN